MDSETMRLKMYAIEVVGERAMYAGPMDGAVARKFECQDWLFLGRAE